MAVTDLTEPRWKWRLLILDVCLSTFELVAHDYFWSRSPDKHVKKIIDRVSEFRERADELIKELGIHD